ncbi:MAG: TetR/AcrR family transcriptional regulator [Alphaproteobacteria bacterium]
MARTRSEDYDVKRRLILDKAAALFAERGFRTASLLELARACNGSKSWIYHYYPSKEAILYDILSDHMTTLLETAERGLAETREPRSQLRSLLRGFLEIYAQARSRHKVLLNDLHNLAEEQQSEIVDLERRVVDIVVALLSRLNPKLMAEPDLGKPVAMMLFGAINWTYTWYRPDGPVSPERFADLAADVFLNGLLAANARSGR